MTTTVGLELGSAPPASVDPLTRGKTKTVVLPRTLKGLSELPKTWDGDTSTSVRLFADGNGNKFIAKQSKHDSLSQEQVNAHTETEFQAGCALRAMGVPVPATALIRDDHGNPLIMQEYVDAKPLHQVLSGKPETDKSILDQITPHFYTFAIMGGWDVAGLCWNNILVDAEGKVFFVDQGLMFGHMHNGLQKSGLPFKVAAPEDPYFRVEQSDYWNESNAPVIDLFYLRNYADRLSAAHIFDSLTDEDIKQQAINWQSQNLEELFESGVLSKEHHYIIMSRHRKTLADFSDEALFGHYSKEWKKLRDANDAVMAGTPKGRIPMRNTRGVELLAAKLGLYWPAWDGKDPKFTPKTKENGVGLIIEEYQEGSDNTQIWLRKTESGYELPHKRAKMEDPIWDATFAASDWGIRVGVTGHFYPRDIQVDDRTYRFYSAIRAGGIPREMVLVSLDSSNLETLFRQLSPTDRSVLESFLEALSLEKKKKVSGADFESLASAGHRPKA